MSEDQPPKSGDSSDRSGSSRRRRRRGRRRPGKGQGEGAVGETDKSSGAARAPRGRSRTRRRGAGADGQAAAAGQDAGAEAASQDPNRKRKRRRRSRGRGRPGGEREAGEARADSRGRHVAEHRSARMATPAAETAPGRAPSAPPPLGTSELDLGWDDTPPPAPVASPADESHDREIDAEEDSTQYGDDADAPTPDIALAADLPGDPPSDDPDPVTAELDDAPIPDDEVRNVVGVRFSRAGKIYLYDAGDETYSRGETVILEGERGVRVGEVAVGSVRRPHRDPPLRLVLRRSDHNDRRAAVRAEERARETLTAAREQVRSMRLQLKVFRAEAAHSGRKVRLFFSSEDRADFRGLVRELSRTARTRIEMRQTGVRDQAKMVGGIGSCGCPLCCSTWLPDFVPVSIKNAKDQGLVLNPSKVSGQCGRLKCCLVYEQEAYAELRKGLPKMGKRVITQAGEGRVVEVDVLKQRVRVSLGSGESMVFGAGEVEPMFPSQKPKKPRRQSQSEPEPPPDSQHEE